jgi:hypothetical protein
MLIKNIHLMTWLDEASLLRLEQAALAHQRFSNITFKIISAKENILTVQVAQSKSFQENHFDAKRLVEITKELFAKYHNEMTLHIGALPYVASPVEIVTSEWVTQEMSRHKIALKQLAIDTGINKSSLSSVITGDKPLSDPMRAMFYYYFKTAMV